jgi:hypothetical protein
VGSGGSNRRAGAVKFLDATEIPISPAAVWLRRERISADHEARSTQHTHNLRAFFDVHAAFMSLNGD